MVIKGGNNQRREFCTKDKGARAIHISTYGLANFQMNLKGVSVKGGRLVSLAFVSHWEAILNHTFRLS